jgi:uncharacterized protein YoxC
MPSAVGVTFGFFQFVTFLVSVVWIGLFIMLGVLIVQYQDVVFTTADRVDQILNKTDELLTESLAITDEVDKILVEVDKLIVSVNQLQQDLNGAIVTINEINSKIP